MADAQRLAACQRVAPEHHAAGEHRHEHRVGEAADQRHQHEHDRTGSRTAEDRATTRARRRKSASPRPTSDAIARREVARLGCRRHRRFAGRCRRRLRHFHRMCTPRLIGTLPPRTNQLAYAYAARASIGRPAIVAQRTAKDEWVLVIAVERPSDGFAHRPLTYLGTRWIRSPRNSPTTAFRWSD